MLTDANCVNERLLSKTENDDEARGWDWEQGSRRSGRRKKMAPQAWCGSRRPDLLTLRQAADMAERDLRGERWTRSGNSGFRGLLQDLWLGIQTEE